MSNVECLYLIDDSTIIADNKLNKVVDKVSYIPRFVSSVLNDLNVSLRARNYVSNKDTQLLIEKSIIDNLDKSIQNVDKNISGLNMSVFGESTAKILLLKR